MSDVYGVIPEGFRRKRLDAILVENEEAARTVFGQEILLDPETPMGQVIGLVSLIGAQFWEVAEDTYQSLSPDQAEGVRLDMIGRIRGVERPAGESDAIYRRRITNTNRSDIHLRRLVDTVAAVEGVTYVRVWENAGDRPDARGIAPHSLAVAVIGGLDALVAQAIYSETVAGIGLSGNVQVEFDDAGLCRTINITRLTIVDVRMEVDVRPRAYQGCVTPDSAAIAAKLEADLGFQAEFGLVNGEDLTDQRVIGSIAQLPGLEVLAVRMTREPPPEGIPSAAPVEIAFDEIARIAQLTVTFL